MAHDFPMGSMFPFRAALGISREVIGPNCSEEMKVLESSFRCTVNLSSCRRLERAQAQIGALPRWAGTDSPWSKFWFRFHPFGLAGLAGLFTLRSDDGAGRFRTYHGGLLNRFRLARQKLGEGRWRCRPCRTGQPSRGDCRTAQVMYTVKTRCPAGTDTETPEDSPYGMVK
jgi:hypothetical protein